MANAGFNAATDLFNMGAAWKVKSSNINASGSTAECPDKDGDITHRDAYAHRIAPSAEYELVADVTSLPDLGTIVTIDGTPVGIETMTVKCSKGSPVTLSVTGKQVESGATTGRKYSCGTVSISKRHKAQDILGLHGDTVPTTMIDATFAFACDITTGEPKGTIESSDVSNGRVVASFSHVSGTGAAINPPTVTGTAKVVSSPATTTSPENDYVTTDYSITDSLTGSETAG